jgi:hypothetical protein
MNLKNPKYTHGYKFNTEWNNIKNNNKITEVI